MTDFKFHFWFQVCCVKFNQILVLIIAYIAHMNLWKTASMEG